MKRSAPALRQNEVTVDNWLIESVEALRPTRHKIGHFGDVLPSQSRGIVPKKLNLTQLKHTDTNKL